MKEDYSNINMPCWICKYGHNCKYYSDSVWDQWIINNNSCPALQYEYTSIYKAIKEEYKKKNERHSPLNRPKVI